MNSILLVSYTLNGVSGIQTCLVNFLNAMAKTGCKVDLLLLDSIRDEWRCRLGLIPDSVKVLPELWQCGAFDDAYRRKCAEQGHDGWIALRQRIRSLNIADGEDVHRNWRCLEAIVPEMGDYDAAIAYEWRMPFFVVSEKVRAKRKFLFWHMEIGGLENFDRELEGNQRHLGNITKSICVSRGVEEGVLSRYPSEAGRTAVAYNPIDADLIREGSAAFYPDEYGGESIKICTVGTPGNRKGLDLIVECARLLKDEGLRFRWVLVGDDRAGMYAGDVESAKTRIGGCGIAEQLVFAGPKANPYPYIRNCDIYAQPSRNEGFVTAVEEAKVLARPCVIGNFAAAPEQIADGETGFVVDSVGGDYRGLAMKIALLANDKGLRERFSRRLEGYGGRDSTDIYRELFGQAP
ncbi:MAG: glycosyltransferase [Clostridiales Family XIII bacterium]|jgi:glycosyltransferase involved in cell wall biosynthesis|nr:glycosyltransferase [Clostridiales Family XIII bacterium]